MDALALLCTLHADGPTTLERLRKADCSSLDALIALDAERLAATMRTTSAHAERFLREASSLKERVGSEDELAVVQATSASEPVFPDSRKRNAIERVLERWRDEDRGDESDRIELESAAPERAEPRADRTDGAADSGASKIVTGAVDGLDADATDVLARAGVRDLRALASSDALTLARRTGLAYTRVVRLRALAKRAVGVSSAVRALQPLIETAEIKLSAAEHVVPPEEPLIRFESDYVLQPAPREEGVGGPFAYPL